MDKQIIEKSEIIKENIFTKNQLILSKKYGDRKDLLNVILEDNKSYSIKEVNKLIDNFMKAKVK